MTRSVDKLHTCPFCEVEFRGPGFGNHKTACESRRTFGQKAAGYGRIHKNPPLAKALHQSAHDHRVLADKLDAIADAMS